MGITPKTRKMLWAKSGNICNFKNCGKQLCIEVEADNHTVIGEECHIVAKSANGPRGASKMKVADRDEYDNLILLCSTHHKEIDDNPEKYTRKILIELKKKHEKWVEVSLSKDEIKEIDFDFDEEVIFDKNYLEEVCDWIAENTENDNILPEKISGALNELQYLDKKARKLLIKIINYKNRKNNINIKAILNKLVNDGDFDKSQFFDCIELLEEYSFIEFDDRFEFFENEDGECILLMGKTIVKYMNKECWLAKNGAVIDSIKLYFDDKNRFKGLIQELKFENL